MTTFLWKDYNYLACNHFVPSAAVEGSITFWGEWLIFEPSDMTIFHWSFIVLVGTSTMVIEIDSQGEF